jgi:hypothetical protein
VNHALTLRFQGAGFDQDIEGRFHSDAIHSFCQFHFVHAFSPPLDGTTWALCNHFQLLTI